MRDPPSDASHPFVELRVPTNFHTGPVWVVWRVTNGQRIAIGQILLELEAGHATVEIESTHAGQVELLVESYANLKPGQLFGRIWTS